ncbi:MAG TPA: hypothetical protein VKU36_00105, partial [Candidatus Babeliales bacterium]|nr:hypothetical protein [Candidatus Babeliales bacterium]
MRIVLQLILCVGTFPFLFSKVSQDIYTGIEDVTVISTLETKNCFISYVMINGKTYLLKQKKDFKKQLAVIRDALAAYVAAELRIAHRVEIIDPTVKFP